MPRATKTRVAMINSDWRLDAGFPLILMNVSRDSMCGRVDIAAAQGGGKLRVQFVGAGAQVRGQDGLLLHFVLRQQYLYEIAQPRAIAVDGKLVGRGNGVQASGLVDGLALQRL